MIACRSRLVRGQVQIQHIRPAPMCRHDRLAPGAVQEHDRLRMTGIGRHAVQSATGVAAGCLADQQP